MILQALVQHYEDLLAAGEVVRPGWARAKVSYGLDLSGTAGCWACCRCKRNRCGERRR